MNPEDDPEKRIQQLERPLTEQAHTSELGTSVPPSNWAPPPPGYYGPSMPQPSVSSSAPSLRIGWIVFVLLVLGLTAGGGALLIDSHLNAGRTSPGLPTISGGGGTFTTATRPSRSTPTLPSNSAATVAPPESGVNLSVSGVNENKRLACDDSVVTISGMDNTVVITGHCTRVQVSGMNNIVTVDSADTIEASGMDNEITYHAGSPTVDKSGFSNAVGQG
ncbi:hypothetical protein Y900_018560 [Mycolicibacterium aromaticivorans JS19b1 = JCM 16368]|uniref:DUF3060 domain-containing protein n=1 Tax=Mycolicibacterium aromaticivorans JS19b1 = JCM 16368 TaxID=1440774 RepID=A0A064CJZ0_9MYCO|nr:DUF3060 domain-containing protein [Mycolicibacterium aromaticivorans]KDF00880.1 hypothetical protein Y900_018560 [Mycolicibacterium aromaticivorans JS19b1 = JCM 16368]